jgi:hypothetical protein
MGLFEFKVRRINTEIQQEVEKQVVNKFRALQKQNKVMTSNPEDTERPL